MEYGSYMSVCRGVQEFVHRRNRRLDIRHMSARWLHIQLLPLTCHRALFFLSLESRARTSHELRHAILKLRIGPCVNFCSRWWHAMITRAQEKQQACDK